MILIIRFRVLFKAFKADKYNKIIYIQIAVLTKKDLEGREHKHYAYIFHVVWCPMYLFYVCSICLQRVGGRGDERSGTE